MTRRRLVEDLLYLVAILVAAVAILVAVAQGANAHSTAALDEWWSHWSDEANAHEQPGSLDVLADMMARHPYYSVWYDGPPPTVAPKPKPPPTYPAPVAGRLSEAEMRDLLAPHFDRIDAGLAVSWCESRWNPAADNPHSPAAGLWQFVPNTWDWVAGETGSPSYRDGGVWDPEWSTINAAWLSDGGRDWSHWACKP